MESLSSFMLRERREWREKNCLFFICPKRYCDLRNLNLTWDIKFIWTFSTLALVGANNIGLIVPLLFCFFEFCIVFFYSFLVYFKFRQNSKPVSQTINHVSININPCPQSERLYTNPVNTYTRTQNTYIHKRA